MHSGFAFILVLLIPIAIVLFVIFKKKKTDYNTTPTKQKRDEVWRSIKYFLKQNGEQGKEIIDSYVAKRPNQDLHTWKKENKAEWKEMNHEQRKQKADQFKKHLKEIYVVTFVTRDSKTKKEDAPRAIECELIYAKTINKNDKDARNIVINGQVDYAKESVWIDPLRKRDESKLLKEEKRQAKRDAKRAKKAQKNAAKAKANKK